MSSIEETTLHAEKLLAILRDVSEDGGGVTRVLVLDRDPAIAEFLRTHLPQSEADIVHAGSVFEAREALLQGAVSLCVCDPAVAADGAWKFMTRLMDHAARNGMDVVAIRRDEETVSAVELYLLGVEASLGPPLLRSELLALVRTRLRRQRLQERAALSDPATGCATAAVFRDAYARAASLAAREHEDLSVVLLHVGGLDRLRRAGEHSGADEILRDAASSVAAILRQSDLLARGSGDSLLLLLPSTNGEGAHRVIEKAYSRLARNAFLSRVGDRGVELSAGVAEAENGAALADVLETAACALAPLGSALERALSEHPVVLGQRRHRILLAEDDALTASIIRHRMERLGHEVLHLTDGATVLATAPDSGASLLLLDVKLPFVDGFEILRRLRSTRPLRDLPVMLITSLGNEEDIARGFELGASDYLVKPFSPVELQARVQRLLQ